MDLPEDDRVGLLANVPAGDNSPPLTVSELAGSLKRVIEGEFGKVRVRGEISGFKRHASGHCYFTLKDDAAMTHMPELVKLGRHPNVAVKATGAPGYCSGPYPFRSMHPYLRQIYDAFGPERMFWGTDISKMPCSWRQCVTMFTEELPWLSERDKELVMGQAVCAWWGWSQPA